nr:sugar transferase [Mycolicibacterium sediminis]
MPSERTPRVWHRKYARRLIVVDAAAVVVAVAIAQWVRFGFLPETDGNYQTADYTAVSIIVAVCWLTAMSIFRTRSPRIIGEGLEEYRRVWLATISAFGAIAIVAMVSKHDIARGYLIIALPVGAITLLAGRWIARQIVASARARYGKCITRVLVVGNPRVIGDLARSLARDNNCEYEVVGACVPGGFSQRAIDIPGVRSVPICGDESDILLAIEATNSHAVALTATERLDGRAIRDISWQLEKLDVDLMVAPGVVDVAGPRLTMRAVAGLPLIHVEKPQYDGAKRFEKRLFDVVFASAVLFCLSPILLLVAAAIKMTSKGPVFYRSERIGMDGEPFQMIKFRTMVPDADELRDALAAQNESDGGVLFKIRSDPRVTPVGRILRKYSIDEIPQFINVLKNDMSVVGPRPPLASEVTTYDDYVKRRLLVRPGITGLWQVSGRSDLSWEDTVRLDLFYVENWSFVDDLIISAKTVRAMISGDGAY